MGLTLSGPDGLDLTFPSHYGPGAALSRAVTEAERGCLSEASYYVRRDGVVVGRVDRENGMTLVRAVSTTDLVGIFDRGAEDANLQGEPARATGSASEASSTRRPGSPRRRTKEEPEVTEAITKSPKRSSARSSAKKRSATPARTKERKTAAKPTAAAVPAAEPQEDGNALYQVLLGRIRETVEGVQVKENKSKTSSRLLTKSGRAFAYIFPPRKGGVALKIPKQLLDVESELPEGHGFKRTSWGLTRTVKTETETQIVAHALGVAAKAVTAK